MGDNLESGKNLNLATLREETFYVGTLKLQTRFLMQGYCGEGWGGVGVGGRFLSRDDPSDQSGVVENTLTFPILNILRIYVHRGNNRGLLHFTHTFFEALKN